MIATTLYIDFQLRNSIIKRCSKESISFDLIADMLFKKLLSRRPEEISIFSRVKYQPRIPGRKWYVQHINFHETTYESCLDLRKLYKKSVSFLFELAVNLYFDAIMEKLKNKNSSFECHDFYCISSKIDNMTSSFSVFHTLPLPEDLAPS